MTTNIITHGNIMKKHIIGQVSDFLKPKICLKIPMQYVMHTHYLHRHKLKSGMSFNESCLENILDLQDPTGSIEI